MNHHVFPSKAIVSLANRQGIKNLFFYMDSHNKALWDNMIIPNTTLSDLIILNDNPLLMNVPNFLKNKTFFFPCPYKINYDVASDESKNGVTFLGSTSGLSISRNRRREFLDYCLNNEIVIKGYPRKPNIDYKEYINVIQCGLININFSWFNDEDGITGRSFETFLCKSLLIENKNKNLEYFFKPETHYVNFTTKEELVDKIRYYLNHKQEALEIGQQGYKRHQELFPERNFWRFVLFKC